jgi:aldose 1-epimerase
VETVTITSPSGETLARFVPDANLVCDSLRHRNGELLDPRQGLDAYAQRGKTMGIPLLYPWANRLSHRGYAAAGQTVTLPDPDGRYGMDDETGLAIHGALPHLMRWVVVEHAADRLRATLRWEEDGLLELFPFRHRVEVEATVSDGGLRLQTTVVADGDDEVPVCFGYHPYLTLPGSDRRGWQVDLGAASLLTLDEHKVPTGERTELTERDFLLGDSFHDDAVADLTGVGGHGLFLVGDGERELAVTFEEGYAWGQVFAKPGFDFICFEPMTAPADALNSHTGLHTVAPGGSYTAAFSIAIRP